MTSLLALVRKVYGVFGMEPTFQLSTRNPDKMMGALEDWDKAEASLASALTKNNIAFDTGRSARRRSTARRSTST